MSKTKFLLSAIILASVLALGFLALERRQSAELPVFLEGSEEKARGSGPQPERRPAIDSSDESGSELSQDEIEQIYHSSEAAQWRRENGYYDDVAGMDGITQSDHSYDSLSDADLNQLANGGDMIAATMLGDRFLASKDSDDRERGIEMHRKAVTLGSTYSSTSA
ncbi:MAG: hypothetical protein U5K38_17225 [Woeseiaceae bacterium]|nr:hypothetical protein [Woeseiaceae bacterium]